GHLPGCRVCRKEQRLHQRHRGGRKGGGITAGESQSASGIGGRWHTLSARIGRCWTTGQGPEPEESLVDKRLHSEVRVTTLRTDLARQELRRDLVAVGFRGRMPHRKIVQRQGANLHTGL